jgi:predicted RNA binding protein YcfA (HicA-like mRNA interferase family)
MKEISEKFVEKAILKHLAQKGWDYNVKTKGLHEKGYYRYKL